MCRSQSRTRVPSSAFDGPRTCSRLAPPGCAAPQRTPFCGWLGPSQRSDVRRWRNAVHHSSTRASPSCAETAKVPRPAMHCTCGTPCAHGRPQTHIFVRQPDFDSLTDVVPVPRPGLRRPQTTLLAVNELLVCLVQRVNWMLCKSRAYDVRDTSARTPAHLSLFRWSTPRQLWYAIKHLDDGECLDPCTALRYGDESCFTPVPLDSESAFLHGVAQHARLNGRRLEDVAAVISCDFIDSADNATHTAHVLCFQAPNTC